MNSEELKRILLPIISFSDESFAALNELSRFVTLKKGDILLKEGEHATEYFLVKSGQLRTFFIKDGKEINSRFTFEGEFTANLKSLKSKQPSETTTMAAEPSEVWRLNIRQLAEVSFLLPELLLFMRRLHTRMLIQEEEHSNMFRLYNPAERYHYIEEQHPRLLQRVSLTQLASYLGVTRETLGNIRRKK